MSASMKAERILERAKTTIQRLKAELVLERAKTERLAHELVAMDEHGHLVNEDWKTQLDEVRKKSKQYRDRVTLTRSDVKTAGVTWPVVQAWAKTQPTSLTRSHSFDTPDWYAADQDVNEGRQTVRLIIATCNLAATLAKAAGRDVCPLDVLEEMAALKESTCPTDA